MIDQAKLTQLFDAHAATLVLYARQWLDIQSAQDVTHEVFIKLFSQSREIQNPRAWLYRAIRNAAISAARSDERHRRREQRVARDRPDLFDSQIHQVVDAKAAEAALADLPPDLREITVLRIWADLSFAEIADQVGRPLSSVFDQYKAALTSIRKTMESSCSKKTL